MVVTIWVDNYGKVVKAQAGADGTTVTDKSLWAAARNAAMGTRFKQKMDAPAGHDHLCIQTEIKLLIT